MSPDDAPVARNESQELQFDRVETARPPGDATSPSVSCVVCKRPVGGEYFAINAKPVCATCRDRVLSEAAKSKSAGPLLRAGAFGLGAAIAGAAIYYAVIAIAHLEIGLVAILIGYMVGWSVRKGARGLGGRRFQILAVALTYWAVGLAYAPLALSRGTAVGLGGLFVLVFALPVMSVFGSMPYGLISALIIFIGMRQAWTMTAPHVYKVSGPYKVGAGPAPVAG